MKSLIKSCFVLTILLTLGGCAEPNADSVGVAESAQGQLSTGEYDMILRLTDDILRALVTHQYDILEHLTVQPDRSRSGLQIAQQLLGPNASTLLIEKWDTQRIDVSLDPDGQHAKAIIPIMYRTKPNRKPTTSVMVLHFIQINNADWRMTLPSN